VSRRTGLFVFAAVLAAVTIAKLAIVTLGPDYDGDAYAHAMAGRRMLQDPGDVSVHWVWLPLLHGLYATVTSLGGGLSTLRLLNVFASTLSPVVLYLWLRHHEHTTSPQSSDTPSFTLPWLAATLLAADPLCLWLGVTGQTEPLFQLFLLAGAYALARRSFFFSGLLFAAAALTRYEAWPLVPVIAILAARESIHAARDASRRSVNEVPPPARSSALRASGAGAAPKSLSPFAQGAAPLGPPAPADSPSPPPARKRTSLRFLAFHAHASLAWLLPLAAVAGWCLFHARVTNEPLQFLRLNREFVSGFLGGVGYSWGKQALVPLMALQYVALVPLWNMLGAAHLLAFPGLARAARQFLSRPASDATSSDAGAASSDAGPTSSDTGAASSDAGPTSSDTGLASGAASRKSDLPARVRPDLPLTLLAIGLALLAIITLGFLRGSHLGLPRHAVVLAPFFCALVAVGAQPFADRLARRFPRFAPPRSHHTVALLVLAVVLALRTLPETLALASATRHAFSSQAAAAKALTSVARPGEPIFCDDGKIEVLSELPPDRFTRWQIPDVAPFHIQVSAKHHGSALVVSAPDRTLHLPGGTPLWTGAGLVILRFEYNL
jgi:hypothetical protein